MEKYSRCGWETEYQWQARKQFIKTCITHSPGSHIEALSMVWSNTKFLGCKYPAEIDYLLQELESKSPLDIPAKTFATPKVLIPNLTIYEPAGNETVLSAISILYESCQKSKKTISFQDLGCNVENGQFVVYFSVSICDTLIATSSGTNKKSAKRNAAERALNILRSCQPVKKKIAIDLFEPDLNEPDVKKKELVSKAYMEAPRISEDNIGNQMLKRMGWKGSGGLGKEEQGRDTPVMLSGSKGKFGLGKSCETINMGTIKKYLVNFMSDHTRTSLKFSAELKNDERKLIHRLVGQYKLKSKSFGKDEERYLVVYKPTE